MLRSSDYRMLFWLVPALATGAVIARGFWLYRASLTWPTADGVITRVDIERKRGTDGGHYFRATLLTTSKIPVAFVSQEPGTRISPANQKPVTSPHGNWPSVNQS